MKPEEIKKMNIFEKLSCITNEIETVSKNLVVGTGSAKYKAVAEKDVLEAVKDIEHKYRVYSYPKDREIIDKQVFSRVALDKEGKERTIYTFYVKIKTIYTFVNIDNPTETIDMITYSEGIDTADKGFGKAMTYADKYALLKAYKIETGDDPDKEASPTDEGAELTLETALESKFNFGKYKGSKIYDIYQKDMDYIDYLTNAETPNQFVASCVELFNNMPINKLKQLVAETNSVESLLKKYEVKSIDHLTNEQIAEAIETLEEYKKKKEGKITNNMLEEAEKEVGK